MNKPLINEYYPNYASPPGDTLQEILEDRAISQAELAYRMRRPKKTINEILQGKAAITPDTALQLERVLDIPASFWNNREQRYRETLARLAEEKLLKKWVDWLDGLPIKEMITREWIPPRSAETEVVFETLKFFAVASPEAWRTLWKQRLENIGALSHVEGSLGAMAAWLREGERRAQHIDCSAYDAKHFRQILLEVRSVPRDPPDVFEAEVVRRCAQAGVAVTFVPALPSARLCGAARWLSPSKALIQLSPQYRTDDTLFFREAAHILLHGKRDIFLEPDQKTAIEQKAAIRAKEQEADKFAAQLLSN